MSRLYIFSATQLSLSQTFENGNIMESLSDTVWDVVLSGTGLSQSLLAL